MWPFILGSSKNIVLHPSTLQIFVRPLLASKRPKHLCLPQPSHRRLLHMRQPATKLQSPGWRSIILYDSERVRVCVCACVRVCVRACGRACVRACVRGWVGVCVCVFNYTPFRLHVQGLCRPSLLVATVPAGNKLAPSINYASQVWKNCKKHSSEKCKSSSGCYGKNAVWVTAGLACLGLGAKGSMVEIATASSCRFWPAKTCCCNVASSLEVPTSVPAVASHLSQASWQGDAHV